jgi:hypothetical protein
MKYRIVIETEESGKKWYYVQKRTFKDYWLYLAEEEDISKGICRTSLEEVEECIQRDIDKEYQEQQSRIVKREYILK